MKKLMLAIFIALSLVSTAYGADSILGNSSYAVYQMPWVTDGSGNFTAIATTRNIDGIVLMVEAIPSATAAPTDNYDVTLRNNNGIDIMGDTGAAGSEVYDGSLANLDTAVPSQVQPKIDGNTASVPVLGPLTLDVFNAGNSKGGTIRIHYIPLH